MNNLRLTEEERALSKYIPNMKRLKLYVERMSKCKNMKEVSDQVLLPMLLLESTLKGSLSERKDFYSRLRPFIKHLRGSSNTSLYERICKLNETIRKEKKTRLYELLLQQIRIQLPENMDKARYIINLLVHADREDEQTVCLSISLVTVDVIPLD